MIKGLSPKGKSVRNRTILELREKYWTLQKIGDKYGLSRERIRVILLNEIKKSANSRGAEKIK